jgi:ABC-type antimicrobial peptide transport system permease subunit
VRALDPELPLYRTMPMSDALDVTQWNARVSNVLLYGIAFAAVALAAIGLYAVIAHAVLQRTREIGIRVALGAQRARVLGLVARRAVVYLSLGIAAGIACVFGFERLIAAGGGQTATLGPQLTDPVTLAASAALLAIIAIAACIAPAWSATRVDPVVALRTE